MQLNREKYIDVIMYILARCCNKPNLGKTVLCSILYFIDSNYYELYGKLLTKETYVKSKRGIKPTHFKEVTEDLISSKKLFLRKEPYYHRTIHRYYLTIIPSIKFSREELEIIDFSINALCNNNASTIMKYAIKDPPLMIADFGENIDYRYVFCRNHKYSARKIKISNK
ncbi:type II toxin-antitoxin system antitoxin SocA domain-containing protein [uncultured Methanobrevibacter sp.]|uniref:type II toxin-antitoxin system antitoxin SocA domain-containing protein n=1 Tax=uncultured Methanobrevibacter sp. TaxID=253161 RepID=UPI0025D685FE|nr:type II toxin-antitoxin system antitoxin SocA domain-containing protein [uncultured Methanobrevibacter sp.]